MTSAALEGWRGASSEALDEIESMYARVDRSGGQARQLSYAYATMLMAHFQTYCRAIHTEAILTLVASIPDPALASVIEALLTGGRFLEKGNPTPKNLERDFGRFGFRLWKEIEAEDLLNGRRRQKLEHLCEWRNAIVHGDIAGKRELGRLVPRDLTLDTCRDWRLAVGGLAGSLDVVVALGCRDLGCRRPW